MLATTTTGTGSPQDPWRWTVFSLETATIESHWSLDMELLAVECRSHCLPQEFSAVIVAVYIPPDANASLVVGYMLKAINKQ